MTVEGILGKKIGMTQIFTEDGESIPVTVVEAGPCPVLQVRTSERDGYQAVQLGFDEKRPKNTTRPVLGHFKAAGVETPRRFIREFRTDGDPGVEVGQEVTISMFEVGEVVKVTGTSKGRGFAGTIKRHGFHRGPVTHGSRNIREPGSIGCATSPGRVFKGRKMSGHMGASRSTMKGLRIVRVDEEQNLLLLRGAVPGPNGGYVMIRKGY